MGEVGAQLLSADFPDDEVDRAEGVRHLAQQVVCWLGWSVGHSDPTAPAFQRQNDLVTKWGGPNADNVYRHARIDVAHTYKITGRMGACDDFIIAMRAGFMHMEKWGTRREVSAADLRIGPGDEFEITLSADPARGAGRRVIIIDPDVVVISIREYYWEWNDGEPATFSIECLDAGRPTPQRERASPVAELHDAATAVERSVRYWNDYLGRHRADLTDNVLGPPFKNTGGLDAATYGFGFYDLGPGEALLIESDVPDARYWSFQLASLAWFESLDFGARTSSLNHRQITISRDGRMRLVIAHRDPGVPNWLDTEGRRAGLVTYRWFWSSDAPHPTSHVVALDQLLNIMPPDTLRVSGPDRARQLQARMAHVARRFRV